MERNSVLKILLPVLILISGTIWIKLPGGNAPEQSFKKDKSIRKVDSVKKQLAVINAKFKKDQLKKENSQVFLQWGRNPFYIEEPSNPNQQDEMLQNHYRDPVLNGIFWDDEHPSAVINNRYVAVNDTLAGYTVVSIRKHVVVLSDGLDSIELRTGLY